MSYTVERATPCRVALNATAAKDEVAGEREKTVATFAKAARIDGFRKGKAPRRLVERHFGKQIREELEEVLIRRVWDQVRETEKLRAAGSLRVRETNWRDDGEFEVKCEFDVFPDVTLPALDGFVPPPSDVEPSEDEIEQQLTRLRERQAVWDPVEGEAVVAGMLVETEVHGEFPDGGGEPFHNENSLFALGAGETYPEVEAAVLGRAVGDEVTAERVLGPDAGEERLGKRIVYRIKIKGVRRKRLPDADDAFAASVGVEGGLAALRARVGDGVRHDKLHQRRDARRAALIRYLADGATLPLPESLVEEETREELVKFARLLAERGVDPERAQVDWSKMEQEIRPKVEDRIRGELLLDAAAEKLGVEVSDADVDHEVEHQAKRMGAPFAEVKGNLAKRGGLDQIRGILRRERALDVIAGRDGEGAT